MSRRLGDATWTELAALTEPPIVAIPIGSCEQHGPHLPLDTDTRIAEALAAELSAARPTVWVGPTIGIGASWEHHGFPGLLSSRSDALGADLIELARSAPWCGGLVFVNGHGGNVMALDRAVARIVHEGRRAMAWSPRIPGGDAHAGRTETSLLLALDPGVVRIDRIEPGFDGPLGAVVAAGVFAASPNGILGDPRGATAEEGRTILDRLRADLLAAFDGW